MSFGRLYRPSYGLLEIIIYGLLAFGPGALLDCIFGRSELVLLIGAALGLFFVICFNHILQDADNIARERDKERWMRKGVSQYLDRCCSNCNALESMLTPEQLSAYREAERCPTRDQMEAYFESRKTYVPEDEVDGASK